MIGGSFVNRTDKLLRNAALFKEADCLEAMAYQLLSADAQNPMCWQSFRIAKALADSKRMQAVEELSRLKRH